MLPRGEAPTWGQGDVQLIRIFDRPDGRSSVKAATIDEIRVDGKPYVDSGSIPVTSAFLRNFTEEVDYDWHPPSQRQLIVVLSGSFAIEAEDGTTATVGPGEVLLAEDMHSKGHLTRSTPGLRLYIPIVPGADLGELGNLG